MSSSSAPPRGERGLHSVAMQQVLRWLPIVVIALAAIARAAALWHWQAHLSDDRDDYLLVARQYIAQGFWTPFERMPSSFRPPLYPLTVAALFRAGGGPAALGILQLI